MITLLFSSSGAAVSAVGQDAHHRCGPDPRSGLQGPGGTLSQLSDPTDYQQTATVHQQPHSAGECRIGTVSLLGTRPEHLRPCSHCGSVLDLDR